MAMSDLTIEDRLRSLAPSDRKAVAEWLRQEARGLTTPHVRRVLFRLAKHVEEGGAISHRDDV